MDVHVYEHKNEREGKVLIAVFHLVCSKDTKCIKSEVGGSYLHLTYKCLTIVVLLSLRLQNDSSPPLYKSCRSALSVCGA